MSTKSSKAAATILSVTDIQPVVPKVMKRAKKVAEAQPIPPPSIQQTLPNSAPESTDDSKASKPAAASLPVESDLFKSSSSISKMSDNFVFIDNIYRSRMTLLDILEARGYDVAKFRKFSPAEATAAASVLQGLSFKVSKKDNPAHVCDVRYDTISRQKLERYFNNISDDESETTEVVVMMPAAVADAHHVSALKEFMKMKENPTEDGKMERRKLRVSFFSIYMLVINPLHHVLVPKHEIVPESEHKELMSRLHVTAKTKFPEIKFHVDPIARCIGAIPGDIVKITRPSQSSGETIIYRVCAP
jgi:DNA-directed RNA polymerase subunit H (RpoH/RPB5)